MHCLSWSVLEFRAWLQNSDIQFAPPVSFGAGKHYVETTKLSNIYILIPTICLKKARWMSTRAVTPSI